MQDISMVLQEAYPPGQQNPAVNVHIDFVIGINFHLTTDTTIFDPTALFNHSFDANAEDEELWAVWLRVQIPAAVAAMRNDLKLNAPNVTLTSNADVTGYPVVTRRVDDRQVCFFNKSRATAGKLRLARKDRVSLSVQALEDDEVF